MLLLCYGVAACKSSDKPHGACHSFDQMFVPGPLKKLHKDVLGNKKKQTKKAVAMILLHPTSAPIGLQSTLCVCLPSAGKLQVLNSVTCIQPTARQSEGVPNTAKLLVQHNCWWLQSIVWLSLQLVSTSTVQSTDSGLFTQFLYFRYFC